jgi:hypothetical protein
MKKLNLYSLNFDYFNDSNQISKRSTRLKTSGDISYRESKKDISICESETHSSRSNTKSIKDKYIGINNRINDFKKELGMSRGRSIKDLRESVKGLLEGNSCGVSKGRCEFQILKSGLDM